MSQLNTGKAGLSRKLHRNTRTIRNLRQRLQRHRQETESWRDRIVVFLVWIPLNSLDGLEPILGVSSPHPILLLQGYGGHGATSAGYYW